MSAMAARPARSSTTTTACWWASPFAFLAVCLINTVGLLLAKFLNGAPITGVRRALGASRRQIFPQHLVEVGVLSALGALLGLALAALGLAAVHAPVRVGAPSADRGGYQELMHFDVTGVIWAVVLAVAATLAAGLYPAWRIGRLPPARVPEEPVRESTMSLHVRPILSALLRNRTGAVLVAMQIAIALAVLVNALYIVMQRAEKMGRPSGIDVDNVIVVASAGFTDRFQTVPSIQEDLGWLRSLPGVVAATADQLGPAVRRRQRQPARHPPGRASHRQLQRLEIDEHGLAALGVRLIAGRNFTHDEIQPPLDQERQLALRPRDHRQPRRSAERFFPGQNPLGKRVYDSLGQAGDHHRRRRPHASASWLGNDHPDWVFFLPRLPVRLSAPAQLPGADPARPARRADARGRGAHGEAPTPTGSSTSCGRSPTSRTCTYLGDRSMGIYLLTVTALLIAVTCLGIFALATFNVSTRTKQIGTRRAVGARRRDIVRYFLVENGLITSAGIIAGCLLALATGYWLSDAVRPAAPEPLLPGGRRAGAVGDRAVRGLAAGAARGGGVALGRHPHGVAALRRLQHHGGRQRWC